MPNILFQIFRDYQKLKDDAVGKSVNVFEAKTNPLFVLLFFALLIFGWVSAVIATYGLEKLYNDHGSIPVIIFFVISYFFFYLSSKLLFAPTEEEAADDTSVFALFSACSRKSGRSLAAICLSLFHTLILVFYLVNKDLKFF